MSLKIKKNNLLIIEASSYQLAHSKFIKPDFALLLNITNDHLDWHGNMNNYINSKFKIFRNQKRQQYSFVNKKLKLRFKEHSFVGKLIVPKIEQYKKIKNKIKNSYFKTNINDEIMSYVFALTKILKISEKSFLNSLNSFVGLPHRYEVFFKTKNCTFINDSKATTFQAAKFALKNTKNAYWIVGGLPKKNDKINLNDVRKNIIKIYIIGKNTNFFERQIQNQVNYKISKNLKNSLSHILKDIKLNDKKENNVLLSPASASFDQFLNFEKRGEEFKKLTKYYVRKDS